MSTPVKTMGIDLAICTFDTNYEKKKQFTRFRYIYPGLDFACCATETKAEEEIVRKREEACASQPSNELDWSIFPT